MSSLVEFDDLGLLDAADLRAVFSQVAFPQAVDALAGAPSRLQKRLLSRLPGGVGRRLEAELAVRGPVSLEAVRDAQRLLVEALCQLSRRGIVAFDDPADMLDLVA